MTFPLPPITARGTPLTSWQPSRKRVATGNITPSEATEIAKVIDAYVKAYQTAELDERVPLMHQLSDAELMRIALGGRTADNAVQLPSLDATFAITPGRNIADHYSCDLMQHGRRKRCSCYHHSLLDVE